MSKDKGLRRLQTGAAQAVVTRQVLDPITLAVDGSILINAARLAAPASIYDADVAWVQPRFGAVSLFFGKVDMNDSQRLRSRLELRYPSELFITHFIENAAEFRKGLDELVGRWPLAGEKDSTDFRTMPAGQQHSEWVNFDHLARTGSQASLDFYHLSPAGLARYVKKQGSDGLELIPRVRVLTTIHELARLFRASDRLGVELREQVPTELMPSQGASHE